MAHFEFKLVDKTFFGLNNEERVAKMDEIAKQREEEYATGKTWDESMQDNNPFPLWLKKLIRAMGFTTYDDLNQVYKVNTKGHDKDTSDEEYAEFKAKYEAEAKGDPEKLKWYEANHLTCHIRFDDEQTALSELDAYLSGGGKIEKKSPKRSQDQ